MKYVITLCLIVSLATVAWTRSESWGRRLPNDRRLYSENVVHRPLNGNYWSVNVAYPPYGQGNRSNITAIYVYDSFTNSSGAQASLWAGGPGYTYATVNFRSQFARGINSTIEFYGR